MMLSCGNQAWCAGGPICPVFRSTTQPHSSRPLRWSRNDKSNQKNSNESLSVVHGKSPSATRPDRCRILRYNHGHTSMIPGRTGCELVVLITFCVLMIFFFPVMQGPYSVVHGPATAFQAARAAARLR